MADTKITALAAIATVDPAADVLPIVDISDTSMAASGTTKKITSNQILGAGGTATLASATITGAATVGTTLGVTGAATVGTATALATGSGRGNVTVNGSTDAILAFGIGGVNSGFVLEDAGGMTLLSTGATYIRAYTNGVERYRVDSTGNVTISTGNVVMATSGKGIDFSAVTGGTGTATGNVLNDYEEGTWDAAFISTTGTVTINTGSNRCRYTKIGRLVTVQGLIEVTSVSSPTGNLVISGLPFTIATATEGDTYSAASICADLLEVTATGQIVGFGAQSSTSIYLYRYQAGALIGLAPSAKANSQFFFTLTYSV